MNFPFKPGDKVRQSNWVDTATPLTITAVGETGFLAIGSDGREGMWVFDRGLFGPWEPYVAPPVRRRWTFETEEKVPASGDRFLKDGRLYFSIYEDGRVQNVVVGEVTEVSQMDSSVLRDLPNPFVTEKGSKSR